MINGALNRLRQLPKGAEERLPHPLTVSEAVLTGDFLGGEPAGLHHEPCGLDAQTFDCLRGGLPRFLCKQSTELPGA